MGQVRGASGLREGGGMDSWDGGSTSRHRLAEGGWQRVGVRLAYGRHRIHHSFRASGNNGTKHTNLCVQLDHLRTALSSLRAHFESLAATRK